jgi:uncharacterized protein YPO0396
MILAQIAPDMLKGINTWLLCAGALLWLGNEGWKFVQNVKGKKPEPANEQLHESHKALSNRVDRMELEVAAVRKEMRDEHQANEKHASSRSNTIFGKMEDVRKELKKDIDDLNKEVSQIPAKILEVLTSIKELGKQ